MSKLDGSEQILCLPALDLPPLGITTTGFYPLNDAMGATLDRVLANARFLPRTAELEADPTWRQLVVYTVASNRGRVLTYRRGKAGTEQRLHDRRTIGGGGHWNSWDSMELPRAWSLGAGNAARREILEEFGVQPPCGLRPVGLLVDDRDAVGRVHLGAVVHWQVPDCQCDDLRFGTGIDFVGWCDGRELRRHTDWEGWSALLIPDIARVIGEPRLEPQDDIRDSLAVLGAPLGGRPGVARSSQGPTRFLPDDVLGDFQRRLTR